MDTKTLFYLVIGFLLFPIVLNLIAASMVLPLQSYSLTNSVGMMRNGQFRQRNEPLDNKDRLIGHMKSRYSNNWKQGCLDMMDDLDEDTTQSTNRI